MNKKKKILYIGNDLAKKNSYNTSMETLSNLLFSEGYIVYKSSNKKNKILRLIEMCWSVLRHKNVDFMLIDTFSTTNFYFALITSQLARFFNLKYIPILHGGNLPFRLDQSKRMSNLIFKNSFRNVAPSNYLKKAFEDRNYKAVFVPNILEIKKYPFNKRVKIQPKLLWVRSFKHLYNPTLAIEVLNLLKQKYSLASICMVGPYIDDSFKETKKIMTKYSLDDSVEFTGVLPKEKWHEKSKEFDVFINTTNFDNTPVSVMEAMALGLPVVSTNAGGMPYLIQDKIDGLLVDKNNAQAMYQAIIEILEGKHATLSEEARKKVEGFDWEEVKKKWYSILR